MSTRFRQFLRNVNKRTVARATFDGLGMFCATILFFEHILTFQGSEGPSMYPTFSVRGDWLLISRHYDSGRDIKVGDIVRFNHPSFVGVHGAKRVLGMPGDFVCRDSAYSTDVGAKNEMIQIPEGHVYVAGDNLPWSRDSRNYGPLPMGLINGKIVARIWPPSRWQSIENTFETAQIE